MSGRIRSFLAKAGLAALSVLLTLIALEGAFILYDRVKEGKFVPVSEKLLGEYNAYQEEYDPETGHYRKRVETDTLFPHPYLGYVRHSMPPEGIPLINTEGFFGRRFAGVKEEGVFRVMITGGSVATGYGAQRVDKNLLERDLNARYAGGAIKRFEVMNRAHGAWKQPQQLINVMLHAHEIDALIVLDGYNEAHHIWNRHGLSMDHPSDNYYTGMQVNYGKPIQTLALRIDGRLRELLFTNPVARRSHLCYFVITRLRAAAQARANDPKDPVNGRVMGFGRGLLALPNDWDLEKKREYNIQAYKRYTYDTYVIAKAHGVKSLHLLQPTAYHRKTLSEKERASLERQPPNVFSVDLYLKVVDELLKLREQGVPIFSLLDVFEPAGAADIYNDPVHFNDAGMEILEKRVLQLIEQEWGLRPVR
jgi:hypothetical protein